MRNILYVTDTGSVLGGGEISLLNLLEHLDRSAFAPFVALPGEGNLSQRFREMGIPVIFFPYKKVLNLFTVKDTASAIDRIVRTIQEHRIDLVHTNSTGGILLCVGLACRRAGIPLVSHIRQMQSGFISDLIQGMFSQWIVMISRSIGKRVSFFPFKSKLVVIHNGVNVERFSPGPPSLEFRKQSGAQEGELLVGAIGTFVRGKGFEYLIKAAALVRKKMPSVKFVIVGIELVGKDPYRHYLETLSGKSAVDDILKFMGRREDIPIVLSSLDTVVFPSLIDPFGRVIIEAMACAKPVVAFSSGGAPEIIEDAKTGFLVRPRDYRQLAQKIEILLKDKRLAEEFGRQARIRCEQLFDIKLHAKKVEKVYLEVLRDPAFGFVPCAVCGSSRCTVIDSCRITDDDARIPEKTLNLCRCRECGLVYVNPQPRVSEELYAKDYFEKGYMKFYGEDGSTATQSNEPFVWRLDLIERYKKPGTILDIGCASGEFLAAARQCGWAVIGIDVSEYAVESARRKHNLDVRKTTLEEANFAEGAFDVITAGDILEHTRAPADFLREIRRTLKSDGILYLALPNFASVHYQIKSLMARFNHRNYFILPHHLYHFAPRTISRLLDKEGFFIKTLVLTESKIQEKGIRRLIMEAIFFLGRISRQKDRIVLVAGKKKQR